LPLEDNFFEEIQNSNFNFFQPTGLPWSRWRGITKKVTGNLISAEGCSPGGGGVDVLLFGELEIETEASSIAPLQT